MFYAIGLVELSSIAKGIAVVDAMLKAAEVELLVAKSICPGKYIAMVNGDVAAVSQAVDIAKKAGGHLLVDHFVIPNIHPSIMPAISGVTEVDVVNAISVIETYSVATAIEAADAAVKAASVIPIRIHMAFGIGGKCYFVLNGDVAAITAATEIAVEVASAKGLLVQYSIIPRPAPALIKTLI
ncbi:propanediol utilization protein PduT [Gammaproteobacteria bacterium]|nr:propanediol utilization protein PduT [Gammaproteobacteria bacterium]